MAYGPDGVAANVNPLAVRRRGTSALHSQDQPCGEPTDQKRGAVHREVGQLRPDVGHVQGDGVKRQPVQVAGTANQQQALPRIVERNAAPPAVSPDCRLLGRSGRRWPCQRLWPTRRQAEPVRHSPRARSAGSRTGRQAAPSRPRARSSVRPVAVAGSRERSTPRFRSGSRGRAGRGVAISRGSSGQGHFEYRVPSLAGASARWTAESAAEQPKRNSAMPGKTGQSGWRNRDAKAGPWPEPARRRGQDG